MEFTKARFVAAKIAYDAYANQTGGVSLVTGDKLPPFEELKEQIKDAWVAAAAAAQFADLAKLFNEWLRRFIDEPARYEAQFQTVMGFLDEVKNGAEPSYGEKCVAMLQDINGDFSNAIAPATSTSR